MKTIRCAFVASYNGPYYSNFIASALDWEREMQKKGYHTVYVFPSDVKEFVWLQRLKELNSNIYFVDYNPRSIMNVRELRKIFKKEKINLIYSRMCGWDFAAHFAAPFTPIIWHMDMYVNVVDRTKKIKNWLKFKMLGFGRTFHIGVSDAVAEAINTLKPRHRCVSIPNAMDFDRLISESTYEENNGEYKILMFGWAPVIKGVDTALDAFEKLVSDGQQIKLLVSAQEQTYRYIEARYTEQPDWLELIPPTDTVGDLYRRADALLSASKTEGFSYCLGEALYCGLPAIVSNIPGTRWADDFQAVFPFQVGEKDSLAEAICTCMRQPISIEQCHLNRDMMIEKYSLATWSKKIISYMEKIMITE